GPTPSGLTALPKDPRPADPVRGAAILQGHWRFGAAHVDVAPDHAPWGPPFPSLHFADRIHRFHWLRDVASQGFTGEAKARLLADSWPPSSGKWAAFAWRLSATADRLINLLSAGPWLLGGLEPHLRESMLESLARQARHLHASGDDETDRIGRFRI